MNIAAEELIDLVNDSVKCMKFMVPDEDYYTPRGSSTESSFEYICPYEFMSNLQHFIEANEK